MPDLIDSLRSRFSHLASTDIVGTHGNPQHAYEFWQAAGARDFGLEVLAWSHLNRKAPLLATSADSVAGFHGKIGWEPRPRLGDPVDWFKVNSLNAIIRDNKELFRWSQIISQQREESFPFYVLNHAPAARQWLENGFGPAPRNVVVAIENHVTPGSFVEAQQTETQLQEKGFQTQLVFDIVHSLRSRPDISNYAENWALIVFINEAEYIQLGLGSDSYAGKPMILKLGKEGAIYRSPDEEFHVPAPRVTAVETSGAGDVLAGAFLGLCSVGVPPRLALEKAVQHASHSVTQFGVEHLIPHAELR